MALSAALREALDAWHGRQAELVERQTGAAVARQQEMLDESVRVIRQAARRDLGVDLVAHADRVPRPALSPIPYTFEPPEGWKAPFSDVLRAHLPGGAAQRGVRRRLRQEAVHLVDMHIGRIRAQSQIQITETARRVGLAVAREYGDLERRLTAALGDRTIVIGDGTSNGSTDRDAETLAVTATRLEALARTLTELSLPGAHPIFAPVESSPRTRREARRCSPRRASALISHGDQLGNATGGRLFP